MVIFINGAFGVGKTTVARLLVQQLPQGTLFDPEPIGVVLSRLLGMWPFRPRPDDFQDLRLWRATSIRLIRLIRRFRGAVVVPMAFSNVAYLCQFLRHVRRRDSETFHFCLTASHATVRERLNEREGRRGPSEWQLRRSAECCLVHEQPEFAEHIATEGRPPHEVAEDILTRILSCKANRKKR